MLQITKCRPRADKVLVDLKTMSDRTEGGLFIPDQVKEKAGNFGKVISVGPDVEGIRRGDIIVFGKYAGTKVKDMMTDGEYLVVADEDVLLHIENDELGLTLEFDLSVKLDPVTTHSGLSAALLVAGYDASSLAVTPKPDGTWVVRTGEGATLADLLEGLLEEEESF